MDPCLRNSDFVSALPAEWRPVRLVRALVAAALMLLVALAPAFGLGQEVEVLLPEKECQVKYALLYSFGLLTTWPAEAFAGDADSPFVIGLLGTKPYPEYLKRISQSKKIQNRRIVIEHYRNPDEIGRCQILYVTNAVSEADEQAALRMLSTKPVLVVSERRPQSGETGATIQFVIEQGAVKFLLEANDARNHHLHIDPRLVKLRMQPPAATQP